MPRPNLQWWCGLLANLTFQSLYVSFSGPSNPNLTPEKIKYANRNSLPFYAVNRGHGLPISQAKFSGLEIDMQLLTGITIQSNGKSALFQGGTYDQQVMDTLWEEGYVTSK